eukprot:3096507-Rhodomonas_salina.4
MFGLIRCEWKQVAGLKPAPVAVNYLGFPYTLTIPEYNYILTDRIVTPPEQHASCFVEKVALKCFGCGLRFALCGFGVWEGAGWRLSWVVSRLVDMPVTS